MQGAPCDFLLCTRTGMVLATALFLLASASANATAPAAPAPIRGDGYTVRWEDHDPKLVIDQGYITIYLGAPQDPLLVTATEELDSVLAFDKEFARISTEKAQRELSACGWHRRSLFGWLAERGTQGADCFHAATEDASRIAFAYFNAMISILQSPYYDGRLIPAYRYHALANLYRTLAYAQELHDSDIAPGVYRHVAAFMADRPFSLDTASPAGIRFADDMENEMLKGWQASLEASDRNAGLATRRMIQYGMCVANSPGRSTTD